MSEERKFDDTRALAKSDVSSASSKEPLVLDSEQQENAKKTGVFGKVNFFQPWFEPGTTAKEKKLIIKLDIFILTYSCLAWFLKYLDQQNITNAYANGMKEDFNMTKNQLSWLNTYFSIGTIIGSIPASLLITKLPPNIFLPACDFIWGLFVLFLYKCTTVEQMYALRFCCGFMEASANPCIHFILGSFYRKSELGRRSAFFVISGVVSQAISGFIMNGLNSSLDGRNGLPSYKWLFIIDFVIGIPIVLWGIVALPGLPNRGCKAWYLSEWDKEKIKERIETDGRTQENTPWTWGTLKTLLTSWQPYAYTLAYSFWCLTAGSYCMQFMTLFLKYKKNYTQTQINYMPDAISCVNLITMISSGIIIDLIGGRRWPVCIFVGLLMIVGFGILRSHTENAKLRLTGYIITGVYGCFTPILSGWANIACGNDPKLRAFTLSVMVAIGTSVVTPFQQYVFPSSEAPFYKQTNGFSYALAFTVCLVAWTGIGLPLLETYMEKKKKNSKQISDEEEDKVNPIFLAADI
ncbi:hypothetical protein CANARDRAFT_204857 [[Candida] arabinofermentans NRRL YB-2248]|uniref:Major facilitator superfamily (MFS) profile domain-containing protein n=1 Tax=[Candida] arabinofermentans NRRL YB-2248 TaxID=983967 RepID=A0A1E4SSZ1_9ASCO|nr:hypothetical protein CANARDRAFT_204857 [[Candida] arabinofermentans NRRL YB-2248]